MKKRDIVVSILLTIVTIIIIIGMYYIYQLKIEKNVLLCYDNKEM